MFNLYKAIHDDEYWSRLWIIQEIGKAARIQICYVVDPHPAAPACLLDWRTFIQEVNGYYANQAGRENEGPNRLDRQLAKKYTGGSHLCSLLETHRDAKCKEPHDKVYGLLGLANDSEGFPIDYGKSLFDVWADTLTFLRANKTVKEDEMVRFAQLLLQSLGGPKQVTLERKAASKSFISSLRSNTRKLAISLTVLGRVTCVGPELDDMVSDLEVAKSWASVIQRSDGQSEVLQENDELLRNLLKMPTLDAPSLGVHSPPGICRECVCHEDGQFKIGNLWLLPLPPPLYPNSKAVRFNRTKKPRKSVFTQHCRLYRLTKTYQNDPNGCSLGIAPKNVREHDILCRISHTGRTFFVRVTSPEGRTTVRIIGTAVVAQDLLPPEKRERLRDSWDVTLELEAEALYLLLNL